MAIIDPFSGNCSGHYGHLHGFSETLRKQVAESSIMSLLQLGLAFVSAVKPNSRKRPSHQELVLLFLPVSSLPPFEFRSICLFCPSLRKGFFVEKFLNRISQLLNIRLRRRNI
jgi:hypothetical protein